MHSPQVGKAITLRYLRAAMVVLNGPSFRYLDEWVGDGSAVLEFETEMDGLTVNGVDMIWWNESGQITRFRGDGAAVEGAERPGGADGGGVAAG